MKNLKDYTKQMETVAAPVEKERGIDLTLLNRHDSKLVDYLRQFIDVDRDQAKVFKTSSKFNIENLSSNNHSAIINIKRVNDTRYVNKFFEEVNNKLSSGGLYIGCFESKEQRKKRVLNKFSPLLSYPLYTVDFIWKRVFPKVKLLKKVYFGLTEGKNRVLSTPEVLGRLVSCGFKIIDFTEHDGKTYFCVKKINYPQYDKNPTYGPLITLNRVGYKGRMIKVFKVRTMHPYSEYLQDYIYQKNDLRSGGKFSNDYRITSWGKTIRKLWLDELPMLLNWFKGDLKLIGVRPLSEHYFQLYPEDFREIRNKHKPGLIPPFYVDLPGSFDEIVASEKKYLKLYDKNSLFTDFTYFFKSLYNIIFKQAHSY